MVGYVAAFTIHVARYPLGITYSSDCSGCTTPLLPLLTGNWALYAEHPDRMPHIFGRLDPATGSAILTFTGTYAPRSGSLWLSDVSHHHLALVEEFSKPFLELSSPWSFFSLWRSSVPLYGLVPVGVPIPVFLLGLFTSGIQALVFATLAAAYVSGAALLWRRAAR